MELFDFHHHHLQHANGIYNLGLYETVPKVDFSVGVHPWDLEPDFEEKFSRMQEFSQLQHCIAIGECGLDARIADSLPMQENAFRKHILWANEIRKPVIVHCVRRFPEIIKLRKAAEVPLVIHGFQKKAAVAEELKRHNFYLSFGKALLQNVSLQDVFKNFPIEKLFLETDTSDLPIMEMYKVAASLKKMEILELHQQLRTNFDTIKHG